MLSLILLLSVLGPPSNHARLTPSVYAFVEIRVGFGEAVPLSAMGNESGGSTYIFRVGDGFQVLDVRSDTTRISTNVIQFETLRDGAIDELISHSMCGGWNSVQAKGTVSKFALVRHPQPTPSGFPNLGPEALVESALNSGLTVPEVAGSTAKDSPVKGRGMYLPTGRAFGFLVHRPKLTRRTLLWECAFSTGKTSETVGKNEVI